MVSRKESLPSLAHRGLCAIANDKEKDGQLANSQMRELSQGCYHYYEKVAPLCLTIEARVGAFNDECEPKKTG